MRPHWFVSLAFTLMLALGFAITSAAAPASVHVAVWGQFAEIDGPQPNMRKLLEEFDHPDIEVTLTVVPGSPAEYTEKVLVMLATLGDEAPDLFIVDPEHAYNVYARGVALNLSPLLAADPAFSEELLFWDEYEGKTVGIPASVYIQPLAYNPAAMDAAGLEDPNLVFQSGGWDQETFAQYAVKLTRREGDAQLIQIGFLGSGSEPFSQWPFIWNFGGAIMSPDGRRTVIDSEESITAYQWMADQVVRDAFVIAEYEAPGTYERRRAGDVVFGQGSPTEYYWGLFPYLPEYVPEPSGPAGRHTVATFEPWVINAETREPQAAWEVLKFILERHAEYQMVRVGAIPNQRSLIGTHIELQVGYGQVRTPVEAVWNETMYSMILRPRYPKPEIGPILVRVTLDILGGKVGAGEALIETARQINAILAEEY